MLLDDGTTLTDTEPEAINPSVQGLPRDRALLRRSPPR